LKLVDCVGITVEDNATPASRAEGGGQNLLAKILEKSMSALLCNLFSVSVFSQVS